MHRSSPLPAPPPDTAAAPVHGSRAVRSSRSGRSLRAGHHRRPGWVRLVVATLARVLLMTACGLLFWGIVPPVVGWEPTVVMTGSMQPRLFPGDIAVARPVPASEIRLGQILLVDDPDHAGRLRLHRLVEVCPDGTFTLRGDANPGPDSSPVLPASVHGVGTLRVPYVGLPVVWVAEGNHLALLMTIAALGLLIAGTTLDRWGPDDPDVPTAALGTAGVPPSEDGQDPAGPVSSWTRRTACVLLVVCMGLPAEPSVASATFTAQTGNPGNTWTALTVPAPQNAAAACTNTGLVVTAITVTWSTGGASVVTGYTVQRASGTGSFATVATVDANTFSYKDTTVIDLNLGTSTYRILQNYETWTSAPATTAPVTCGLL